MTEEETSGTTDPESSEVEEKKPKRKASSGLSQWFLDQRGLWVACPRDSSRPPKSVSEPKERIRSGHVQMVQRTVCVWTKKTPERYREWCKYCPNGRFAVTLEVVEGDFQWLDVLMKQINMLYQDQFQLVPGGLWNAHRAIAEVQVHGRVLQVCYRMMFPTEEDNPRNRRLPVEEGPALMKLIETAAEGAYPGLVQTKKRGKRDFCDWFIMPDGHGEIRIYLEAPPR